MAGFDSNFEAIISLISAGSTLSSVLAAGDTTGDNSIVVSNPVSNPTARLQGEDSAVADATASGNLIIRGGDKTAGTGDGGNLLLFAGTSAGGTDGIINITGDTTFNDNVTITGTLNTDRLLAGTATPEGAITASQGAIYQRTAPTSLGNAYYIKLTGTATTTGWAPAGPRVVENFLATGASATFTLTSGDGFYRNVGGTPLIDVNVYWNGVRLTEGASTGDFAVTAITPGAIEIRDGAGSPLIPLLGDRIIIEYLPL
jgi:hypothetical protein